MSLTYRKLTTERYAAADTYSYVQRERHLQLMRVDRRDNCAQCVRPCDHHSGEDQPSAPRR